MAISLWLESLANAAFVEEESSSTQSFDSTRLHSTASDENDRLSTMRQARIPGFWFFFSQTLCRKALTVKVIESLN